MNTFKIVIPADNNEELISELKEVSRILTGLEQSTSKWMDEYGSNNRKRMNYWLLQAKNWVEDHKVINNVE